MLIPKDVILSTLKKITRSALIPNYLLVSFIILIHWVILFYWLYTNYDQYSLKNELIIALLGGTLPSFTYILWGLNRFFKKAYLIIHASIISIWLEIYAEEIANQLIKNAEPLNSTNQLLLKWKIFLDKKIKNLPKILQFIIRLITRRLENVKDSFQYMEFVQDGKKEELTVFIDQFLTKNLIKASENIIPSYFRYLIPINTILFIILWLF